MLCIVKSVSACPQGRSQGFVPLFFRVSDPANNIDYSMFLSWNIQLILSMCLCLWRLRQHQIIAALFIATVLAVRSGPLCSLHYSNSYPQNSSPQLGLSPLRNMESNRGAASYKAGKGLIAVFWRRQHLNRRFYATSLRSQPPGETGNGHAAPPFWGWLYVLAELNSPPSVFLDLGKETACKPFSHPPPLLHSLLWILGALDSQCTRVRHEID